MEKQDGGRAFPCGHDEGMTLRDWFAGMAMQALIAKNKFMDTRGQNGEPITADDMEQFRLDIAASSLAYADAMIAERSRS